MRSARAVFGTIGMAVFVYKKLTASERHHRLDGNHESFDELCASTLLAKIRHVRLLMHFEPDSVARKILWVSKMVFIRNFLHGVADIARGVAYSCLRDSGGKRLIRASDEFFVVRIALRASDDSDCVIRKKSFVLDAEVEAHDIAIVDDGTIVARGRMDDDAGGDHFTQNAQMAREAPPPFAQRVDIFLIPNYHCESLSAARIFL